MNYLPILSSLAVSLLMTAGAQGAPEAQEIDAIDLPLRLEAPSAQLGFAAALDVLKRSIGDVKVEFVTLDCQAIAATEKAEAHVQIDLDLRVFGESSAGAKTAWSTFETALKARAKDEEAPAFSYLMSGMGLPKIPFLGEQPTEAQLERSYRGRVQVALPGSVLRREEPRPAVPEGVKPIDPSNVATYVRALAARDRVQLGSLAISRLKGHDGGPSMEWRVQPQGSEEKPASITAVQLVNYLFLLESESVRLTVTRVRFTSADRDSLMDVSLLLAARY